MIGNQIKVYVSKAISGTYTAAMLKVLSFDFPKSVDKLDRITLNDFVPIYDMYVLRRIHNSAKNKKASTPAKDIQICTIQLDEKLK